MIGVNKGSSDSAKAELIGHIYSPFKHIEKKGGSIAVIIIVLLSLFAVAIAFFVRAKKDQKKPAAGSKEETKNYNI